MFNAGRPPGLPRESAPPLYPRFVLGVNPRDWYPPRDGGVNVRQPGRLLVTVPRPGWLNPRPVLPVARFELLNPRFEPAFGVNPRDSFPRAEFGGVKVRKPGRDEVAGPLPRFAVKPAVGREVLIGRFALKLPRAATELPPKLPRDAVKKRCVFDGAWR